MTPAIRPQPREASDPPPAPTAVHPGAQILTSVIGSVTVTIAAKELGGSPWATLAVALIGATLPVMILYAPKHRHLRVGVALFLVAVAFLLTYGGFSLYDAAADKQTFPRPGPTPTPTATPTASATPPGGGSASVSPESLTCTPDDCGQVTITNNGDADLRVGDIGFAEDRANGFTHDGCANGTIPPGGDCTVDVGFDPPFDAGTRTATLVIPTSDGRNPTVQLEGSGGEPADFSFDGTPTCELGEGTAATLRFTLAGPQGTRPSVATSVSDASPQPVGEEIQLPVDLGEPPPVTVTIVIDPDGEFQELDRSDNTAQAACG